MQNDTSEKQYAYLTTITWTGIVNVSRIIIGHNVEHFWCEQLIHSGKLYTTTDQDTYYEQGYSVQDLSRFKEVHFNGQIIYKDWKFWRRWV